MSDNDSIIIMRVNSDIADGIFNETINCLFESVPLNNQLLNKKVYIYSSGMEEAIVGYVKISQIYNDKPYKILINTGHFKDEYSYEVIKKFGKYNRNCHAFGLSDVTEFDLHLPLTFINDINKDFRITHFIEHIDCNDSIYYLIKEWDKEFSLDGKLCDNPKEMSTLISRRNKDKVIL